MRRLVSLDEWDEMIRRNPELSKIYTLFEYVDAPGDTEADMLPLKGDFRSGIKYLLVDVGTPISLTAPNRG